MAYCYGTESADHETDSVDLSLCEGQPESLETTQQSDFFRDTDMAEEKMEVDWELLSSATTQENSILKRSNSAPLICGLCDDSQVLHAESLRTRRNSATFVTPPYPFFPPSPFRTSISRLHQIKQEEGMDLVNREAAHEWEVQASIHISQSWEENLNLNDHDLEQPSANVADLHPISPASISGIGKQCFSPSIQTCVSCFSLPSSPIPSPTRQFTIKRSKSPTNILRPSILGPLKRKGEMVFEDQPKRSFPGMTNMSSETTQQHSQDRNV
ncbi:P2R1A-PPP2R2A-interacting phosphatase regulator 1-like isoform X2 [Talpa occidentalis]|nr:P2R1A-PPP2R2A-interacting phosphatase regulator 1-like isoform X3 [Talpa occidentalis]XP_037367800.1 P2R1A-PPP2R2A-interacting phosphatase regulator 1-like isoform X2 [Talpa occidentalis]